MVPLLSIGTAQAFGWQKPLRATMNLSLANMRPVEPGEPGYGGDFPALLTWDGYISGGINGYMRFFLINYQLEGLNNDFGHFWEVWQIWDENPATNPDAILFMEGKDEGKTHQLTGGYWMVGQVTYTSPVWACWQGHFVFMSGTIIPPPAEWGGPEIPIAPGRFNVF